MSKATTTAGTSPPLGEAIAANREARTLPVALSLNGNGSGRAREIDAKAIGSELAKLPHDERTRKIKQIETKSIADAAPGSFASAAEAIGFQFADDLVDIARGDLAPAPALVRDLIVEGQVNWFAGHPGHGKTTIAMHAAWRAMDAGHHVVWLDWEGGKRPTVRRMIATSAAIGLRDPIATLGVQFHYVHGPRMTADEDGFAPIGAAIERWPGSLVVFDSASKALSAAGLDENNNSDATRWTTEVVMPTRDVGGTSLVIDHVTKEATRSTPYARGAGAKLADTEVFWYVERVEQFDRETAGVVRLTSQKDREGVLPHEITFRVGDGEGGLPVERIEDGERAEGDLRANIVAILQEHGELSQRQLRDMVSGARTGAIVAEAKAMANDPREPVSQRPEGQSIMYRFEPIEGNGGREL